MPSSRVRTERYSRVADWSSHRRARQRQGGEAALGSVPRILLRASVASAPAWTSYEMMSKGLAACTIRSRSGMRSFTLLIFFS